MDHHHILERIEPGNALVLADFLAEMDLGGMLADQGRRERAVQHVGDERALARARHTGHARHRAQRHPYVDVLHIVLTRPRERDPAWTKPTTLIGQRNRAHTSDVFASERTLADARHRTSEHDVTAGFAAA